GKPHRQRGQVHRAGAGCASRHGAAGWTRQASPRLHGGGQRHRPVAGGDKRLLRPFAQASTAVARRVGGAGLGLVFVRRIARAMGGNLTIESAPGRGCRFCLEVVVSAQAAVTAKHGEDKRKSGDAPYPARSLHILCAEDNPYGRVVLNTILTELGHRPDFVATGEAAVEAFGRGGYDVVLMDITLPGLDGMAAT